MPERVPEEARVWSDRSSDAPAATCGAGSRPPIPPTWRSVSASPS